MILCWEYPLEEGMATHSSILALRNLMDREAWLQSNVALKSHYTLGHKAVVLWRLSNRELHQNKMKIKHSLEKTNLRNTTEVGGKTGVRRHGRVNTRPLNNS